VGSSKAEGAGLRIEEITAEPGTSSFDACLIIDPKLFVAAYKPLHYA
jgi:hypothetical protein